MSSRIPISSRITCRSDSTSSGRKAGLHNTSARMSIASSSCVSGSADVEHRLLVGGERVHLAADRLDRLGDLARAAPVGALEEQVLEEVARARMRGRLVARAAPDPRADASPSATPGSDSVTTRRPDASRVRRTVFVTHATASSALERVNGAGRRLGDRHRRRRDHRGGHHRGRRRDRRPAPAGSSAGPRSPNCSRASPSQNASNDAVSRPPPLPRLAGRASLRSGRSRRAPTRCAPALRSLRRGRREPLPTAEPPPPPSASSPTSESESLPFWSMSSTLHAELVAEREHVFDPVDALALPELRDVDQAVATREDVDERTELGDVDDAALVDRAHLGGRRVEDELDPTLGLARPRRRPSSRSTRRPRRRRPAPRCRRRSPAGSC